MANLPIIQYGITAVIASSGTTSGEIDMGTNQLVGFIMPSAFTGTAISLTMSNVSGGTFVTVQDGDGATLSLTAAASKFIPINNLALTTGLRFLKIVSNATESSQRTIILAGRPLS